MRRWGRVRSIRGCCLVIRGFEIWWTLGSIKEGCKIKFVLDTLMFVFFVWEIDRLG
jgi:hypothetical protein